MKPKTKENIKAIKAIQELHLKGKNEVGKNDLEKLGIDTSSSKIELRNIKLEKNLLFGSFYISVIDKLKDLDGDLISQNNKLVQRIHSLCEAGKTEIPFIDLHNLNIPSVASEIEIGNILLSNYLGIDKSYDISVINREKNIDNKWLDNSVTINRVMDVLVDFHYDKKMLELAEVPLNKELEKFFKEHFESVKKSDPSNKGLIDLTIGNEKNKVAIELKLSRKVKLANESQKCRGQIEDYKKQFGSNLILVIAGEKFDKQEKYLQECIKKAENLGIKSFYMQVRL
jgi:Holliday junction resolvase